MVDVYSILRNQGFSEKELNEFLPQVGSKKITTIPDYLPQKPTRLDDKPNVVMPFRSEGGTRKTQELGENKYNPEYNYGPLGHEGIDAANNSDPRMTNPIGGINITGYQPHGYGNWQIIVGANPKELEQMTPEEKEAIRGTVERYMLSGPRDIRDLNIPGKNISIQAHMAKPAPANAEIATGSANLLMGGSGGWDPHLHSAYKSTDEKMMDVMELAQKEARKRINLTL